MSKLRPTIAVWSYDRTRPLIDQRVQIEGCDPIWLSDMPIETMFARALGHAEFDISELSFSNFLTQVASGNSHYVGLPIFPSRSYRHGAWFVNSQAGIRTPADLKGKRVGVREYSMTAAVVARGILSDEFAIRSADVQWVIGDVDERERSAIAPPQLHRDIPVDVISDDRLLSDMLMQGEIDALLAYKPPAPFVARDARIVRLFPNFVELEKEFAARTSIFPVMHLMGVRRDLLEQHPWLAMSLLTAFNAAKDMALHELSYVQALKISLPWLAESLEETTRVLGEDFWPYGISRNRAAIEALARWHHEQGLSPRLLTLEEMFFRTMLAT